LNKNFKKNPQPFFVGHLLFYPLTTAHS